MEVTTTTACYQRLLLLFPLGSLLIFLVDRLSVVHHDYLFYLGLSIPALVFPAAFWIVDHYQTSRRRTLRLARVCAILAVLTSLVELL